MHNSPEGLEMIRKIIPCDVLHKYIIVQPKNTQLNKYVVELS